MATLKNILAVLSVLSFLNLSAAQTSSCQVCNSTIPILPTPTPTSSTSLQPSSSSSNTEITILTETISGSTVEASFTPTTVTAPVTTTFTDDGGSQTTTVIPVGGVVWGILGSSPDVPVTPPSDPPPQPDDPSNPDDPSSNPSDTPTPSPTPTDEPSSSESPSPTSTESSSSSSSSTSACSFTNTGVNPQYPFAVDGNGPVTSFVVPSPSIIISTSATATPSSSTISSSSSEPSSTSHSPVPSSASPTSSTTPGPSSTAAPGDDKWSIELNTSSNCEGAPSPIGGTGSAGCSAGQGQAYINEGIGSSCIVYFFSGGIDSCGDIGNAIANTQSQAVGSCETPPGGGSFGSFMVQCS